MRLAGWPGTGFGVASPREWGLIGLSWSASLWACLWAIAKDDGWTGAGLVPGSEAGIGARLVAGRYRLATELGRGGMGVVWLAEDQLVGRKVAVKELRALPGMSQAEQQTYRQRALQEARSAARIDHPGAVTLYDVLPASDGDDAVYLIMELVQGPTLAQVIAQHGRLAEATVAGFGLQLLAVLAAAHALGVVHRDIKPANILLTPGGQAKLTDFGIAHTIGDLRLTRSGVMGTQAYMAPELFESAPITPAADVWSLGATLYAAAEGRGPFERDTTGATLRAILIDDPPAPRCTPALAAALAGMLQRDPARRASTAQASAALHTAAQTAPAAPPTGSGTVPAPVPDGGPSARRPQPQPEWTRLPTTRAPAPPPAPQPPRHTAHPPPPSHPRQPGQSRRTPGYPPRRHWLQLTALSPAVKVAVSILWLLVVGVWVGLVALIASAPTVGTDAALDVTAAAVVISLPMTFVLVEALRFRAWLEGTTLVVRHAGPTRRCDLSRSSVTLGGSRGVGRLTARDTVTGQRVTLVLIHPVSRTRRLGARELSALADAIVGDGRQDLDAQRAAAALRAQAGPLPSRWPG